MTAAIHVLITDDELMVSQSLAANLSARGFVCELAASGAEALRRLGEQEFDVLVCDLNLPGIDGLEVTHQARAMRPNLSVIVLTGWGTRENAVAALKEGAFDFIDKPIADFASFAMTVANAGEHSRLKQERETLLETVRHRNQQLESNLAELREAYERLQEQEMLLTNDLASAQLMQQSLLPTFFPAFPGLDFAAYFKPCDLLGGDFFDFIRLDQNRMAFYLADVAGHGVRAAMITVIIHELIRVHLRAAGNYYFEDPVAALNMINQGLLAQELEPPLHATMVYAVVDVAKNLLTVACAGHPRPILTPQGAGAWFVPSRGSGLGLASSPRFEVATLPFQHGDSLLLYSDGLASAVGIDHCDSRQEAGGPLCLRNREGHAAQWAERIEAAAAASENGGRASAASPSADAELDDISFMIVERNHVAGVNGWSGAGRIRIAGRRERPPQPGETDETAISAGWATNCGVLKLKRKANWKQASTFKSLLDEFEQMGLESVFLDLSECASLDSTLLGMIHQYAAGLTLLAPNETLLSQFRELGIDSELRISREPPPQAMLLPLRETAANSDLEASSRLMLAAHMSLTSVSEENKKRFETVIDCLQKELRQ